MDTVVQKRKTIPRLMRYSRACALLLLGVAYWATRANVPPTIYTRANIKTKRQALEAFWKLVDLSEGQGAPWAPKPELLEILASL
jgi:hypothetical protein